MWTDSKQPVGHPAPRKRDPKTKLPSGTRKPNCLLEHTLQTPQANMDPNMAPKVVPKGPRKTSVAKQEQTFFGPQIRSPDFRRRSCFRSTYVVRFRSTYVLVFRSTYVLWWAVRVTMPCFAETMHGTALGYPHSMRFPARAPGWDPLDRPGFRAPVGPSPL